MLKLIDIFSFSDKMKEKTPKQKHWTNEDRISCKYLWIKQKSDKKNTLGDTYVTNGEKKTQEK